MPKKNVFKKCRDAVMTASASGSISREMADGIIASLNRVLTNLSEADLATLESKLSTTGEELVEEIKKINLINKRNALMTIKAVREMKKYANQKGIDDPFTALLSYMEDGRFSNTDAGRGVNATVEGWKSKYLSEFKSRLFKEDVVDDFRKDNLEEEIFKEFYEPGSSGSKKAAAIREAMTAIKQDMVKNQNLFGAFIHFLPEHVVRQNYNPNMVRKMFGPDRFRRRFNRNKNLSPEEFESTFQNWSNFMMLHVDPEKTFKDADPQNFLRGAFDGIMSGKHGSLDKKSGAQINARFFRAGSLAKGVSVQRLMHFKDGAGAFAVHKAMSDHTVSSGFIAEIEGGATNIGLMQRMGPNPTAALDTVIDELEWELSRNHKEKQFNRLKNNKHRLKSALKFLDRSSSVPENPSIHTATASVISFLSMAKLGKLFLFALPDRALMQSVLTRNGVRGLDALRQVFNLKKPKNKAERVRLMMLGGEIKSFINAVQSRFSTGAEGGIPSGLLRMQKAFFNMTGINWLDDIGTDAIVGSLARHAGANADLPFSKLIPELKFMFDQFGITPKEWDAMRSTAYVAGEDGSIKTTKTGEDVWITPDQFKNISDKVIDDMLTEKGIRVSVNNRARARANLEEKYRSWITAQRDEGVLMPGSKEHRLATFGTQAGTAIGSISRLIMMFKTFPISVYTKILRREMSGRGARTFKDWLVAERNSNFHTAQLIAMLTIAGYMSLMLDDVVNGRSPRTPFKDGELDPEKSLRIVKDSFLRGGAGGIQADLLLREYDQGYKNLTKAVGGPAVNEATKMAALFSDTVRGEPDAQSFVDFTKGNLPFVNLFYIKPAVDYLVWYNIQEMLEPGSLRQMERDMKKKFDTRFLISPKDTNRTLTE